MSTILSLPDQRTATLPKKNYLNNEHGILSWLLTADHKRIAILYLISITFFFFIGGAFAGLIRLELLTPQPDLVEYIKSLQSNYRIQQTQMTSQSDTAAPSTPTTGTSEMVKP